MARSPALRDGDLDTWTAEQLDDAIVDWDATAGDRWVQQEEADRASLALPEHDHAVVPRGPAQGNHRPSARSTVEADLDAGDRGEPAYFGRMYAKTLVPGPRPVAALMATTNEADVLVPQLAARGWVPFGDPLKTAAEGQIVIGADRLRLVVAGQVLLDDLNPYAPDGWWTAVDQRQGRCLVVILRAGDVDLAADDAGEQLTALLGSNSSVSASLPVETCLDV